MPSRLQPRWLTRRMLFDVTYASNARHEAIVRSALSAPRKLFDRDPATDLADLAASYAAGLAQTHGFMYGSKRAAFIAAYVFLGLNGHDLDAAEPEVVSVIERVAAREMSETALAEWLRNNCAAANRTRASCTISSRRPRPATRERGEAACKGHSE